MTLSVPLPPQTEAALRQRAVAAGIDPATLASELLTRVLTRTGLTRERLEQISAETHRKFLASGITEEQLGDELEKVKHEQRARKRGMPFDE